MSAIVLTYHSHHVVGSSYELNDHIAFEHDLRTLTECDYKIVPLSILIENFDEVRTGSFRGGDRLVALTFDDGPIFDMVDFVHPVYGAQRSFLNAMIDFRRSDLGSRQREVHGTSFVIASPAARRVMEATPDAQYTYLAPGSMTDDWWSTAIDTGLMGIANHSWDHLHPALPHVSHSRQARADFTQVDNDADADAQIQTASAFIAEKTGGRAVQSFAYPFGHVSEFLKDDYFPRKGRSIGIAAAFSTEPTGIGAMTNQWSVPRLTCGHHWASTNELTAILTAL
jgi:peptidoglycan/xylan/chitin deacetylase (PgdA/CDA1 family)